MNQEENVLIVDIADFKIGTNNDILVTISLGSCVGVVLYDPVNKIGGLAHIMLPDSSMSAVKSSNPKKFADTGIRMMIQEMIKLGAERKNLKAKIVGGACMFESAIPDPSLAIGTRNIEAVKKVLAEEKIPVVAEDTGGNYGRTPEFHTNSGKLIIRSAKYGVKEI